jgi:hypothetical protein
MRAPGRLLAFLVAVLICGCIYTDTEILGPQDAQDIPGVTGRWAAAKGGTQIFVRANPDGTFVSGSAPGKYDRVWRAVNLDNGFFVAESHDTSPRDQAGALVLLQVLPNNLAIYTPTTAQLKAAAAKAGLALKEIRPDVLSAGAGAPKERVLATFKELASKAEHDQATAYKRMGGFVDPGGEGNTYPAMSRLINDRRIEQAIVMGRYLSDRGDRDAQLALLKLGLSGALDRAEAIRHGLRAVHSDSFEGDESLGRLYALGLSSHAPLSTHDAEQAMYWLSMAVVNKTARETTQPTINAVANEICSKTSESDKRANCLKTVPYYWRASALTARYLLSSYESLLANLAAQDDVKERIQTNAPHKDSTAMNVILRAQNRGGGGIYLTTMPCSEMFENPMEDAYVAVATEPGTEQTFGCYRINGLFIQHIWDKEGRKTYTSNVSDYSLTENGKADLARYKANPGAANVLKTIFGAAVSDLQ